MSQGWHIKITLILNQLDILTHAPGVGEVL